MASRSVLAALVMAFLSFASPLHAQDELLINDDRVDRGQFAPRVARGATSNLVICWSDGRNGPDTFNDFDIYGMTVRDPLALGSTVNRRLNDDGGGAIQVNPDIAASPSGTFLCVWEDSRRDNPDIYGAALDTLGLRTGPNLLMNDDVGLSDQRNPRVSAVGSDRYLVVWGDQRSGGSDIYASYRNAFGAPIGYNFQVSVDTVSGGSFQGEPALATNADGLTLVVWLDGREGGGIFGATFDVYGQWLDGNGNLLDGNFKINDAVGDSTGLPRDASPSVAADPTQGFVVAWIDRRVPSSKDPGDVYAQRFAPDRSPLGGNVRVNDDALGRDQRAVRAASSPGAAYLFWEDLRGGLGLDPNVEAARVPYDGSPPGANARVNEAQNERQGTPGACWDGGDAFLVTWEDSRNGASDIYAISFLPDGTHRGADTQMNDDAAQNNQWRPLLGEGPGQYVLTWIDQRNGRNDLYAQWVAANGRRDDGNLLLYPGSGPSRAIASDAAVSSDGSALVVAQVTRSLDAGEIRGFLLPTVGAGPAKIFWVSDSLASAQANPAAAATQGAFAVVWIDSREAAPRLYGQLLTADGTRVGVNHPVLALDPIDAPVSADLAPDPAGGFRLLYTEGVSGDQRLWLIHLDGSLFADGPPLEVAPLLGGPKEYSRLSVPSDGRIEIVWQGVAESGVGAVYQVAYGPTLIQLGPVFPLGDPLHPGPRTFPSIATMGSRSAATWQEKRDGNWSIWMQTFEGGAIPTSGVVRVDQDIGLADQYQPSVGLDAAGHGLFVWTDTRSLSSGSDILARVVDLAPTAVDPLPTPEPDPDPVPPVMLRVGSARPNPFSSTMGVPIEVPGGLAARVTIQVMNAQGARVRTLFEGAAPGERFLVRWDGSDSRGRPVASGVYWLLVEAQGVKRAIRLVHVR